MKEETQGKHYEVDVTMISPLDRAGGNIRKDYGDIDELAKSIEQNGIIVPIRAYRDKEKKGHWIAIDGHRRLTAAMKLVTEKGISIRSKIITVDERKLSDEQLIYEMIITNSGKPLSALEMSEAVSRLRSYGHTIKEIAAKFGRPVSFMYSLELLGSAPKRIRDVIEQDKMNYSLVIEILKKTPDFNEAMVLIEKSLNIAQETTTGKKVKATKAHVNIATNTINSFIELQRAMKYLNENPVPLKNIDTFEFLKKIVSNGLTKKDILDFLTNK